MIKKVRNGEDPDYIIIEDVQNDPKNQNPSPTAKDYGNEEPCGKPQGINSHITNTAAATLWQATGNSQVKTSACFPLKFGNRPLGALYLHFKNTRRFSSDDKLMLSMLTDQMAIAINNAEQYETQMKIQKKIQEILTRTPTGTISKDLTILIDKPDSLADLAGELCSEEELKELFQKLFANVKGIIIAPLLQGRSGAGVVKVQPAGLPHEVVVKFGKRETMEEEAKRFDAEVSGRLAGVDRITHKIKHCSTSSIGGIEYTLIGTRVGNVRTFNEYYDSERDIERIEKIIECLFREVFGFWFNNKAPEVSDLADWYKQHLEISLETLERDIFKDSTLGRYRNRTQIDFDNCGRFLNPLYYVKNKPNYSVDAYYCPIHGDLNGNNMLVDPDGYVWLIDFAKTGKGYVFHDFIKLECVIKFELLKTVDVQALCEFEKALLSPRRFSEFTTMSFSNSYNKDDLKKGFAVIKKLRELALEVISPEKQISAKEYYVGLLYQTLSTLRRTDVRRQHAFLSASMTCDTLDKMP